MSHHHWHGGPVALGVQVADEELLLLAGFDRRYRARNLARDEGLATDRAFVIEQDAVRGVNSVGFPVIDGDPISVKLCGGIRTAWIKRRGFFLRSLLHFAIKFRR